MIMLDSLFVFFMSLVIELHLKLLWLGSEFIFRFQIL
jgi:hypothetical protein